MLNFPKSGLNLVDLAWELCALRATSHFLKRRESGGNRAWRPVGETRRWVIDEVPMPVVAVWRQLHEVRHSAGIEAVEPLVRQPRCLYRSFDRSSLREAPSNPRIEFMLHAMRHAPVPERIDCAQLAR